MNWRVIVVCGVSAVLAVLLGTAPLGLAQTIPVQPSSAGPGISVVGTGTVLAQPDTARITLGTDVFDPSLAKAQAQASQQMAAVIAKLKADGIADSDIHTVNFTVNPQYDQGGQNQGQSTLRGYQVQNLVEVRDSNLDGLGALIDDAVAAGATRVYGIAFEASNMDALRGQARDQAMQDAHTRATQLASDAGVSLGKVVSVDESDVGATPVRAQAPAAAAPAAAVTTPIQPGQLQIQLTVRVTWSIQ